VLLIHGYACNSGYWLPMSKLLTQARISHYGIDLEPPGASIDAFVPQVRAAVQRLREATGSAQVIIVGHSMGGLVARAYLRDCAQRGGRARGARDHAGHAASRHRAGPFRPRQQRRANAARQRVAGRAGGL
jgi:pimeloyl-ACP methyl ester carboxylesterase